MARVRAGLVVVCCFALGAASPPAQAAGPLGSLTQLTGTAGCITSDGSGGTCTVGRAVEGPESIAITHDGKFAYGSSYGSGTGHEDSITAFKVLPGGKLHQLSGTAGCVTEGGAEDGTAGVCTAGRTIGSGDGTSIAISPDDRFLYAVSQGDNSAGSGVAIFKRNTTTGALTQLSGTAGCINPVGAVETGCASGYILTAADGLTLSPDGKFLYVGTFSQLHSGMSVFRRNSSTGALTQLSGTAGCLSDDGLSEQVGHPCTHVKGMTDGSYAEDPVIPPDGKNLYFTSWYNATTPESAEIAFARNPTTGVLTQLPGIEGCTTSNGTAVGGGTCSAARGLDGAYEEAISPNGKNVYVAAWTAKTIVVFKRLADGGLLQLSGTAGCISPSGSSQSGPHTCQVGRALDNLETPAVSPDGRSFYTANYGGSGGISIFARDPSTGALTQLPGLAGCFTTDGSSQDGANTCTVGRAQGREYDVAVSPAGGNVYAAGNNSSSSGFAAFARQATPVCASQTVTLSQATAAAVSLSCMDPNGDPFHRSIVTKPAHGKLSAISPTGEVTYRPAPSFFGTDHIVFRASDGSGQGVPAVITLDVLRDRTKPRCSGIDVAQGRVSRWLAGGLPVHLHCSEAVKVNLTLVSAKRKIASGSGSLKAAGKLSLRLHFTKHARHAFGNSPPRKLAATLGIVAMDRAGNKATKRVHVTLK